MRLSPTLNLFGRRNLNGNVEANAVQRHNSVFGDQHLTELLLIGRNVLPEHLLG